MKPDLKWYDWNQHIDADDRKNICKDVAQLIADGKYFTNSPKYQTNINVMGQASSHWMKIKMSFVILIIMDILTFVTIYLTPDMTKYILYPYMGWILFATYLTGYIAWNN